MSFLDEHCIIFDNEEENKLEYTPLHKQFKDLVEELIGCLLAELDVTQEQFLEACEKAGTNPIHKKIVDQITAVDSFVSFKKLMCKRNAELNKQAMLLLEKQRADEKSKVEGEEEKKEEFNASPEAEPKDKPEEVKKEKQETPKDKANKMDDFKTPKNIKDKDLQEVLKLAQELERQEEEELMRKAIEESQKLEQEEKERMK